MATNGTTSSDYPVQFRVDYPEGPRNRLTVLVRPILALPILIIAHLLTGGASGDPDQYTQYTSFENMDFAHPWGGDGMDRMGNLGPGAAGVGAGLFLATILMILFRGKYPRWWFDWNLQLTRFTSRVGAYLFLLRDDYPSTDEEQAVTVEIAYPDVPNELNRVLPIFKWLLGIPHYVVLGVLTTVGVPVNIIGWIAILITGAQPQWVFRYVEGVMRWAIRVGAYAFLLTTDRYPPFRFRA